MSLSATSTPPARVKPPGRPRPPRKRAGRFNGLDMKGAPYLYIAPFFVIFGIFGAYPMFRTLWMSFHNWNLVNERTTGATWVGLDNYVRLLNEDYFWQALRNTVGIFLLATIPQLLLALFLANILNRPLRAKTFFRLTVLIPNA